MSIYLIFYVLFSFFTFFFGNTLIFINSPLVTISGNLSFIFDRPIICKTLKYIDQSVLKGMLKADWSVGNMSHDMTPNGMLIDVSLSQKIKINKDTENI